MYINIPRVKWSNPGKGIATPNTSVQYLLKKEAFGSPSIMVINFTYIYIYIYIYIYMCVCVCVCVCVRVCVCVCSARIIFLNFVWLLIYCSAEGMHNHMEYCIKEINFVIYFAKDFFIYCFISFFFSFCYSFLCQSIC